MKTRSAFVLLATLVALAGLANNESRAGIKIFLVEACCVRGRVVDELSGGPVAGAIVWAGEPGSYELDFLDRAEIGLAVWTDDAGGFEMDTLPYGDLRLVVTHAQYADGSVGLRLMQGQKLEGVVIRMPAGARIEGRVLDTDGAPVRGAAVALSKSTYGIPIRNSKTDENGNFSVSAISPGTWWVQADPVGVEFGYFGEDSRKPLLGSGLNFQL